MNRGFCFRFFFCGRLPYELALAATVDFIAAKVDLNPFWEPRYTDGKYVVTKYPSAKVGLNHFWDTGIPTEKYVVTKSPSAKVGFNRHWDPDIVAENNDEISVREGRP